MCEQVQESDPASCFWPVCICDEVLILQPCAQRGLSYPGHQTLCMSGAGVFLTSLIALAAGVLFFTLSFSRRVSINLPRQVFKYCTLHCLLD